MNILGLMGVMFALVFAPWYPGYDNRPPGVVVFHYERTLRQDAPDDGTVTRRANDLAYRLLDGLVYLAVAQIG
ncbi:MAG: hypothetical protein HC915_19680, partial [Anaerolineae bacterium]|nr:hypothetical protein [Anaerolineae bacterium]